jgi:hypothetical protein
MADDFYLSAARERANAIEMELAACKADLLVHRQNGSLSEAGEAVQRIADLTSQQSNLQTLCQGYVQSQTPHRPWISDEQRAARTPSEMDQQDLADIMNTSRYSGKSFTATDYDNLRRGLSWYKTTRGQEGR